MSDDDLYKRASKRADEKIGFYKHLASFILVNIIFVIINLLTSNSRAESWEEECFQLHDYSIPYTFVSYQENVQK